MNDGPISPDGRSQWNGTEWVAIPPPPKRKGSDAYAVFIAIALVIAIFVIIGVVMGIKGD
jgi:hypothetical protein